MTEAVTTGSTVAEAAIPPGFSACCVRYAAEIDAAPMADLITCARLFYAIINSRALTFSNSDFAALHQVDDHLCERIAIRRPTSAEEFAAKTHFLIGRVQDENMADVVEAAALASIREDAAALPHALSQVTEVGR